MNPPHDDTTTFPAGRTLHERAARVMPGGVNSATRAVGRPFAFANADGVYVEDLDGNRYLDYHAAFGANLLGYRYAAVDQAVAKAATDHALIGLGVTPLEVEYAELVAELVPSAEVVAATMSGTESVIQAIRLARAATGRDHLLKFQGCFHGWGDAVCRNVISPPERAYGWDPLSAGVPTEVLERTVLAEFNDLASVDEQLDAHGDDLAAIILEPIPHNVGCLLPTQEFVEGLRARCDARGIVLIFDEVITGFRHALGGYQEVCGVTPDLTTFGKAVGNGYPVAGVAGKREIMAQFNSVTGGVLLAGTFNGHPTSMAAAIATMKELRTRRDEFYPETARLARRLADGIGELARSAGFEVVPTAFGSVFVTYFLDGPVRGYRDLLRNDDAAYAGFHRGMFDRGVSMLPLSLKRNHVSGAHTDAHVDTTLEVAAIVLPELAGRLA